MKKLIVLGFLLAVSQLVYAFNPNDLKQLQETCSCPGCDLSNANLSDFKLGDEKTLNTNKVKPDANGLVVCNISQANFSGANLKNAYFSPSDFAPGIHNTVGKVILRGANFRSANLEGSHFNAVIADRSNFQRANMKGAAMIKSSSFKYCNFSQAQMTQISVSPPMGGCGAVFTNSNFTSANLSRSKINADFTRANFSNCNLSNSTLIPCDNDPSAAFKMTNFFGANLTNVIILNQPATEGLLINAKLCKTKFATDVSNRDCS